MPAHPHARATFLRSRSAPLGQNMSQIGRCTCARGPPARYLRVPRSKADWTQTSRFRAALFCCLTNPQRPARSAKLPSPPAPRPPAPGPHLPDPQPPATSSQHSAPSPPATSFQPPSPSSQNAAPAPGSQPPAPSSQLPTASPGTQLLAPNRLAQKCPGKPRRAQESPGKPKGAQGTQEPSLPSPPPKRRCCLQPLLRQMLMPQPQQPSPLLAPLIQTT